MTKREYFISKKVGRAITDYRMLEDGDRVLVAVSGGKDSFSLLKILRDRLAFVPISYEIIAAHINFDDDNARVVEGYLEENGYRYYIEMPQKSEAKNGERKNISSCFLCSRQRKAALFRLAARAGCNKIAFAHHKDDIIVTQLMNLFIHGEISTMKPMQEMFEGRFYIVRPLAYVEEYELVKLALENRFPPLPNHCPQSMVSKRRRVGEIIGELKGLHPKAKDNIFCSLKKIRMDYLL